MISKFLLITGHVQGVGFRDWIMRRARRQGIAGWVRNRRDGTLEALLAGEADAVEDLLRACRRGPPGAQVQSIAEHLVDPPTEPGFTKRPTA